MIDLQGNPYYLDQDQCQWVNDRRKKMSLEEKLGQLFFVIGLEKDPQKLYELYQKIPFGGIMYRPDYAASIKERNEYLQEHVDIPLLVAANLEAGGIGIAVDGTSFASQMEVAATGDKENAYLLGKVSAAEGKSVGVNLAFAPVCDIDRNWRNPITNTRTYGSDPQVVLQMAGEYMRGCKEENVAVSLKHFPGDGCDERDQHLVTTVNDLSCEEWDSTYGHIYQELIQQGAQTVMVGHIMQPAYSRRIRPEIRDEEIMPGSCSEEVVNGLLREKLGFNGVVLTDAANMLGYCGAMSRREQIPATINAGCDMILFGKNLEEDYSYLKAAVLNGVVSMERIDQSVTRILALKASLHLHDKKAGNWCREEDRVREDLKEESGKIVGCEKFRKLAARCADQAITLVKDTQHLLPVTPDTHRRVWLHIAGDQPGFAGGAKCKDWVLNALTEAGFEVDYYDHEQARIEDTMIAMEEIRQKYDVIMYFSNVINASYQTVARINWHGMVAEDGPYYVKEVPTLFVSFGNPYGYVDVPMIRTMINAYHASETTVQAVVQKITGKNPFRGISPVDPFCGMFGAKL